MLRVGLTGNIGSGKSAAGRMFVELGAHIIDSDVIAHRLFEPGHPVYRAVVAAFGREVVAADGSIDRQVLGALVFHDPELRQKLNSIVHPAVIDAQKIWLDELESKDSNAIGIVEAALMIEVGTYKNYDKIVVTICSPEEQKQRLRARSGLSDSEILARIQSQMPASDKVKYADYVIDTSGSLEDTGRQVREIFETMKVLTHK
jgi:dephospho-CoA kinase